MDKYSLLNRIQKLYTEKGINIMKFLKEECNEKCNDINDILISYDFQAGTYINEFYTDKQFFLDHLKRLSGIIEEIGGDCKSILECGTGEGITLVPLLEMMNHTFERAKGIDISWSRIRYAQHFLNVYEKIKNNISFAVGDMFCLPCAENSFDIVFTHHAMEPNGGKEKELLSELYRVTNKYLILLEPAYELADFETQKRMDEHGYIKELYSSAKELGFEIVTWELYGKNHNDLNPTGLMIIKKNSRKENGSGEWGNPVTKSDLKKYSSVYYSEESLLAYPVIDDVPMLTKDNAVVATKFMEFHKGNDKPL